MCLISYISTAVTSISVKRGNFKNHIRCQFCPIFCDRELNSKSVFFITARAKRTSKIPFIFTSSTVLFPRMHSYHVTIKRSMVCANHMCLSKTAGARVLPFPWCIWNCATLFIILRHFSFQSCSRFRDDPAIRVHEKLFRRITPW